MVAAPTVDAADVARFERIAAEWWDPAGKFRPLHKIGPVRLSYVRDQAAKHFGRDPRSARMFEGLRVLDVGCGGGLISEPVARLGGIVTGIDPGKTNIAVARKHAGESGVAVTYREGLAEDLVAEGAEFDVVLALEVIEHVPDAKGFVATMAKLSAPGGLIVYSTINRTLKAFALAIVGAEYVLRWLPRGTHSWEQFVTTDELSAWAEKAATPISDLSGMVYEPLKDEWRLSRDTSVNYLAAAAKPRRAD